MRNMAGFNQQIQGLDGVDPPEGTKPIPDINKDGVLNMMTALLQDGSSQNMKALSNLFNPIDEQIKVIVNKEAEDVEDDDDDDDEEEPIIVRML